MELSVLIPTHRRPEAINRCLTHIEAQGAPLSFEVVIGLDGDESLTPEPRVPSSLRGQVRLVGLPRVGLLKLRKAMMEQATGEVVLWLNDDAYAEEGLFSSHIQTHKQSRDPVVVAGHADWAPVRRPSLFDRLVQESDLVFFSQAGGLEIQETNYRNCFGLNMSFPRDLAMEVGGVTDVEEYYGYEDIEFAWRMVRGGAGCVYQPGARVVHDHRYTPVDVHKREYLLGRAAWAFAHANPEFACDLFRSDLRDPSVLAPIEQAIRTSWTDALRIEQSFLTLDRHEPGAIEESLLPLLAEHWVLLKRLLWRWGVLDAARGIDGRWSFLRETTLNQVLCPVPDPV